MSSWDDASELEVLRARVQSLEEGLQQLFDLVVWAFAQTEARPGRVRPEELMEEEWGK